MYTVCKPHIQKTASVADMNFTMKLWYYALLSEPQIFVDIGQLASWVDVRDCALGHVLSLENSAAGGERLLIAAHGMLFAIRSKPC